MYCNVSLRGAGNQRLSLFCLCVCSWLAGCESLQCFWVIIRGCCIQMLSHGSSRRQREEKERRQGREEGGNCPRKQQETLQTTTKVSLIRNNIPLSDK